MWLREVSSSARVMPWQLSGERRKARKAVDHVQVDGKLQDWRNSGCQPGEDGKNEHNRRDYVAG